LLANYLHKIQEWCALRVPDPYAAEDVAQKVVLRLWKELEDGKHRGPVPFRVVVWKVTGWTIGGHFKSVPPEQVGLPEWDGGAPDGQLVEWEEQHDLSAVAEKLPPAQREVFEAVYLRGLTPGEAAAELRKKPNAVYQALHNAHRAVAEVLDVR
jgi:RNA polymerase sigma factor (sigma-70 family)